MAAAPWRWPQAEQVARLDHAWRDLWTEFECSPTGTSLRQWLQARVAAGAAVLPPQPLRALEITPLAAVRVVILGQDPYHGAGQAHGLAFSVPNGVTPPPSLRNIHAELKRDLGDGAAAGNLESWARDGVLLLNVVLTVEQDTPAAHARRGWEALTSAVLNRTAADPAPKVFMLWGAFAHRFAPDIAATGPQNLVLMANHPSPLAARRPPRPFIGCGHFSQANAFLRQHGRPPVRWTENS